MLKACITAVLSLFAEPQMPRFRPEMFSSIFLREHKHSSAFGPSDHLDGDGPT
jgi:hypothetical protein